MCVYDDEYISTEVAVRDTRVHVSMCIGEGVSCWDMAQYMKQAMMGLGYHPENVKECFEGIDG